MSLCPHNVSPDGSSLNWQQAIPQSFLLDTWKHCEAFRAQFPAVTVWEGDSGEHGILKAVGGIFRYAVRWLISSTNEDATPVSLRQRLLNDLENCRRRLEEASQTIQRLHIENALTADASISSSLSDLHATLFALQQCPPTPEQGHAAIAWWRQQIQQVEDGLASLSRRLVQEVAKPTATPSERRLHAMITAKTPTLSRELAASIHYETLPDAGEGAIPTWNDSLQYVKALLATVDGTALPEGMRSFSRDIVDIEGILSSVKTRLKLSTVARIVTDSYEPKELIAAGITSLRATLQQRLTQGEVLVPLSVFSQSTEMAEKAVQDIMAGDKSIGALQSALGPRYAFLRIARQENGQFSIHIFGGEDSSHGLVSEKKDVPIEYLLGESFLSSMIKMQLLHSSLPELTSIKDLGLWNKIVTRFGEVSRDISTVLLPIPDFAMQGDADATLSAVKGAGTPWKALEGYILERGNAEILLEIKTTAIAHHSHQRLHDVAQIDDITSALLGTQRSSQALKQSGSIQQEASEAIDKVIASILSSLVFQKKELVRQDREAISFVDLGPLPKETLVKPLAAIKSPAPPKEKATFTVRAYKPIAPFPKDYDAATIADKLVDYHRLLQEGFEQHNDKAVVHSVLDFFSRVNNESITDAFLDGLNATNVDKTLIALGDIVDLFRRAYFEADLGPLPDEEAVLATFDATVLAERLMKRTSTPEAAETPLREYSLSMKPLEEYLYNLKPFFHTYSPELDRRVHELQRRCNFDTHRYPSFLKDTFSQDLFENPLGAIWQHSDVAVVQTPQHYINSQIHFNSGTIVDNPSERLPHELKYACGQEDYRSRCSVRKMLTEYCDPQEKALPATFYSLRRIAYATEYFQKGIFIKSNSAKDNDRYKVQYEYSPLLVSYITWTGVWEMHANIVGINEGDLRRNPDLPDGIHRAHQLAHTQRAVIDPVLQPLYERHLKLQGIPYAMPGDVLDDFSYFPGVSPEERCINDLNIVMASPFNRLKKSLPAEDYIVLASLRGQRSLQVFNTFSFFSKHPALLDKPDMRTHFMGLIFDPGLLWNELQQSHHGEIFESQFADFIKQLYYLSANERDVSAQAFYLEVAIRFRHYALLAREQNPSFFHRPLAEVHLDTAKETTNLLSSGDVGPSWRGHLAAVSALEYAPRSSLENSADVLNFLQRVLEYSVYPTPGTHASRAIDHDLGRLLRRFSPQIEQELNRNAENLLNALKGRITTNASPTRWLRTPNPFVFVSEDQQTVVDLLQGKWLESGQMAVSLPADAIASASYQDVFGSTVFPAKMLDANSYEFTDKAGVTYRIMRQGAQEEWLLQGKFPPKNDWYQHISLSPRKTKNGEDDDGDYVAQQVIRFIKTAHLDSLIGAPEANRNPLQSRWLLDNNTLWLSTKDASELLFIDKTSKVRYRGAVTTTPWEGWGGAKALHAIYKVDEQGNNGPLLADIAYPESPFAFLQNFDDVSFQHVWKDPVKNTPLAIELPRFGLNFVIRQGRAESTEFPGYALSNIQKNTLIAGNPHFLLLENGNGGKKLLLPRYPLTDHLHSTHRFDMDYGISGDAKRGRVMVYDSTASGAAFTPAGREAALYLALLSLVNRDYLTSYDTLRQYAFSSDSLTPQEKEILEWILNSSKNRRDPSAEAAAVRALAFLALNDDDTNTSFQLDKQRQETHVPVVNSPLLRQHASDIVKDYKDQREAMGGLRLSEHEEERLFKTLTLQVPAFGSETSADLTVGRRNGGQSLTTRDTLPSVIEPWDHFVVQSENGSDANGVRGRVTSLLHEKGKTPAEVSAFQDYLQDCTLFLERRKSLHYALKDLPAFVDRRHRLEQEKQYIQYQLERLETRIRLLAMPSPGPETTAAWLRLQTDTKDVPSLEDLVDLYREENPDAYRTLNPALTDEETRQLDRLVDDYLDLSLSNVKRSQILQAMENVENLCKDSCDTPMGQNALQSFVGAAKIQRTYQPQGMRALKVFEYRMGINYRPQQIESLKTLGVTLSPNQLTFLALEMIVGGGKSSVLLPLTAHWKADGDRLAVAVMPEALIGNVSKDIERILGKSFGQKVRRVSFIRNKDLLTADFFEKTFQMLEEARSNSQLVIVADKHLKVLRNHFINTWHACVAAGKDANPESLQQLQWMHKILRLLHTKGDAITDEVDVVLNAREELNFPSADVELLRPPESQLALTTLLYRFIISDQVTSQMDFDFLPKPSKGAPFTNNTFHSDIKPLLYEMLVTSLTDPTTPLDKSLTELSTFYKRLSGTQRLELQKYVLDVKGETAVPAWLSSSTDTVKDLLGLLRGQLNILMPMTLSKNYGERYGFHTPDSLLAGPFRASQLPSFGSQFKDIFERIDFSVQAHLHDGLKRDLVEQAVQSFKQRHISELLENQDKISHEKIHTVAEREFQELFGGVNLVLKDPNLVDRLMGLMSGDENAMFKLLQKFVLPQITANPRNLRATSQVVPQLFSSVRGFSGTPWNSWTYDDRFHIEFSPGTRGETLSYLVQQGLPPVHQIDSGARQFIDEFPRRSDILGHINAIIDRGGVFRISDVRLLSRGLLDAPAWQGRSPPINGVTFFDPGSGEALIWERGNDNPSPVAAKDSKIPIRERVTFYDQSHAFGTDIVHENTATALLTVGKSMIMRDFLQAAGRMRQLARGQKIELLVLEEDAAAIRERLGLPEKTPLTFSEIVQFLIANEVDRQLEDNEIATRDKLHEVVREQVFQSVFDAENVEDLLKVEPGLLEKVFFDATRLSPYNTYGLMGGNADTRTVFQDLETSILSPDVLKDLRNSPLVTGGTESRVTNLRAIMDKRIHLEHLALTMPRINGELGKEETQEVEQQQEQMVQQQQEEIQEDLNDKVIHPHQKWVLLGPSTVFTTAPLVENEVKVRPVSELSVGAPPGLFSENLLATSNFASERPYPLAKPQQNILITKSVDGIKVVLLDPFDAAQWKLAIQEAGKEQILKDQPPKSWSEDQHWWYRKCHCNELEGRWRSGQQPEAKIAHSIFLGDTDLNSLYEGERRYSIPQNELRTNVEIQRLLVQAKFLDGTVDYSEEERKTLHQWLDSYVAGQTMQKQALEAVKAHFKQILTYRDQSRTAYEGSDIAKIFKLLGEKYDR